MAKSLTRSESHHPIFGYPVPIPDNQLPTKLALYNHYRMIRTDCKNVGKSNVRAEDIAKELTQLIMSIYRKCSIPTINELMITQKITVDIIERARKISKKVGNMENIEYNKSVQSEFNVLFDVSCCKCPIQDEICRCPLERKIPH